MADRWRQVEELFHRALEREEPDRAAFLDEACAGDEVLRQEVESLLAEESESGFMETPAIDEEARELAQENRPGLEGRRIGSFEILSLLGRGGMGEVWRARDAKLRREVAVKTLPEEFAKDRERLARFEREATLLASLNHPNIAAIYGLEEDRDTRFLVLELVEGDTLADRLKRGAIPVEETLKLALQIAEALEAAHQKGVIHRDLKPANIKVTPEGNVKVLDFGLAKTFVKDGADVDPSESPTLGMTATEQGVILGTAAYMSPEQARGLEVDRRADIWAFGCVLYEALAGSWAFPGSDVTEILAAVLRAEPEWDRLPLNLHPRLREVIERCLVKESRNRYHDIADVRLDIQKALADPDGALLGRTASAVQAAPRAMLPLVAAVAVTAIIAVISAWSLRPDPPAPHVARFLYTLPEDQVFTTGAGGFLEVSPDGRNIVYPANNQLWIRNVAALEARPVPGTEEDPRMPTFSPDGEAIVYWAGGQLKRVPIGGGTPVPLCPANFPAGVDWYGDTIYFGQRRTIMSVSSNGGAPQAVLEGGFGPRVLPGGKALMFNVSSAESPNDVQIWAHSLETGERTLLVQNGTYPFYASTGHLAYLLDSQVFALPFDVKSLEVLGEPVSVIENVREQGLGSRFYQIALSDNGNGTAAYFSGSPSALLRTLVWVDRGGREETLTPEPRNYDIPALSPQGSMVAYFDFRSESEDIWTYDLETGVNRQETFFAGRDALPIWSPNGDRLVFNSTRDTDDVADIFVRRMDPRGEPERLLRRDGPQFATSWSPDGRTLAFNEYEQGADGPQDIYTLSLDDMAVTPFAATEANERGAMFSPNGEWIAYVSDELGTPEVFVMPFPADPGLKTRISYGGGFEPRWSDDGSELFYHDVTSMLSVEIGQGRVLERAPTRELFPHIYKKDGNVANYDVDGNRFLMVKEPEAAPPPRPVHVILNWFEELKERVPVP